MEENFMVSCALTINSVCRVSFHDQGRLFCVQLSSTANLVLEDTVERIYQGNAFAESWRGLYLIRGENVVLLGEIVRYDVQSCLLLVCSFSRQDLDLEDDIALQQVDWNVLEPYNRDEVEAKRLREEAKSKILFEQKGFCKEGGEGDGY
jgi:U6 snRNA-associated Sm-like protein LSm1